MRRRGRTRPLKLCGPRLRVSCVHVGSLRTLKTYSSWLVSGGERGTKSLIFHFARQTKIDSKESEEKKGNQALKSGMPGDLRTATVPEARAPCSRFHADHVPCSASGPTSPPSLPHSELLGSAIRPPPHTHFGLTAPGVTAAVRNC